MLCRIQQAHCPRLIRVAAAQVLPRLAGIRQFHVLQSCLVAKGKYTAQNPIADRFECSSFVHTLDKKCQSNSTSTSPQVDVTKSKPETNRQAPTLSVSVASPKKKSTIRRAGGAASQISKDDNSNQNDLPSLTSTKVVAFATAQEYDLTSLQKAVSQNAAFVVLPELAFDVIHIRAQSHADVNTGATLKGDLFVFGDGSFVVWGQDADILGREFLTQVLHKPVVTNHARLSSTYLSQATWSIKSASVPPPHGPPTIEHYPLSKVETEEMDYVEDPSQSTGIINDTILIGNHPSPALSKLAFSHGLSRSAKVAVLESLLDQYLGSTRHIPQRLAQGQSLGLSRREILQKIGELLSVRGLLNLAGGSGRDNASSTESLLDTPEYYWSKPQLEEYYNKVSRWLDIKPRIAVLNQKLDYASEFAQVLRGHLSEQHSVRLEIIIILLISVEVFFELLHWAKRMGYIQYREEKSEPKSHALVSKH